MPLAFADCCQFSDTLA